MKGRALVVVLALILATVATAGVFLYTRGVKESVPSGAMVPVIVSKVDIEARTDLNDLIKDDQFSTVEVPEAAVVDGAVTSLDQLRDQHNSVAILAGEQIPVARIAGTVPGGALAIPNGMQAINVSLDASRAIAGAINTGDQVEIYATFKDVPENLSLPGVTGTSRGSTKVTVVLVPAAQVLSVYRPLSSAVPGSSAEEQGEQLPSSVQVTLALFPDDAQNFVFSMENGTVWFGLLPPDGDGKSMTPVSYAQVIK